MVSASSLIFLLVAYTYWQFCPYFLQAHHRVIRKQFPFYDFFCKTKNVLFSDSHFKPAPVILASSLLDTGRAWPRFKTSWRILKILLLIFLCYHVRHLIVWLHQAYQSRNH